MNSIFNDDKLINNLLNSLIKKTAQTANMNTAMGPEFTAKTNNVAIKLVNNLDKLYSGGEVGITAVNPINLKPENVTNLSALFKFITDGQIKVNGKQFIYTPEEFKTMSPEQQKVLINPTGVSDRDPSSRQYNPMNYWIDFSSLVKFIQNLQQKAKATNNKILQVYVGSLIDQVNAIKSDSGLDKTPQSQPEQLPHVPDNQVLGVFNTKDLSQENGDTQLLAGNIKNQYALKQWLEEWKVQIKNKSDQLVPWQKDLGGVLNVLSDYAKKIIPMTPQEEINAKYFQNKIKEIGNESGFPVGGVGTIAPTGGSQAITVISKIIDANELPLTESSIDFNRIQRFFDTYSPYISGANKASVEKAIAEAKLFMGEASKQTKTGTKVFALNESRAVVAQSLLNPIPGDPRTAPLSRFTQLMDSLEKVLVNTKQVVMDLRSAYENKLTPNQKNLLFNQTNGIFNININWLRSIS